MARNTPPLHAKGVYTLLAPWTTVGDAIYECIAVRSFADFVEKGQNVYSMFYAPKALDQATYQADLDAGAHIITLQSETSAIIHVPDTYIGKFPDLTGVEYKRIVLSLLLGPLPDTVDLTFAKTVLGDAASDVTGVVATVTEHVAPYAGVVSADQHATLEAARQAAINNRQIDRATVLQQQTVINAQAQRIADLEAIIMNLQAQLNP